MLRRFSRRTPLTVAVILATAQFSTTQRLLIESDPVEREREKELRQQVLKGYRGMQVPEMTTFEYGHFGSGGIQAAAARQAMSGQGFSSIFGNSTGTNSANTNANGAVGNDINNNGSNGGFGGGASGTPNVPFPSLFRVDWLMLFTGAALMYVSGKILYNQMTRGVNDLDFPLWTASLENQAKHLMFCVQYDEKEREDMKREFQSIRQSNPFADFFQWVQSRRPEFCCGNRNSPDMSVGTLVGALSSTNTRELMALATTLRQSLARRGGDPMNRVDDFMAKLNSNGAILGTFSGESGFAGAGHATFSPPTPTPPQASPVHSFVPQTQGGSETHATNPFEHVEGTKETS